MTPTVLREAGVPITNYGLTIAYSLGIFERVTIAETRDYVPKLLAIRRLVGDPAAYGLQFAPIANQPYFGSVDPGRQVSLGDAATVATAPVRALPDTFSAAQNEHSPPPLANSTTGISDHFT